MSRPFCFTPSSLLAIALDIKHSLRGSFCGVSCSILIDSSVALSLACIRFIHLYNLPQDFDSSRCEFTGGLVVLPTVGVVFQSHLALSVNQHSLFDVVLGADWIQACQPRVAGYTLTDPSETTLSLLPVGHGWLSVVHVDLGGKSPWRLCSFVC